MEKIIKKKNNFFTLKNPINNLNIKKMKKKKKIKKKNLKKNKINLKKINKKIPFKSKKKT